MDIIKISAYKSGQQNDIYDLIKKVYDEFVAPDYSEAGNLFFYDFINPEKIAARQQTRKTIFIATIDNQIVGMIEIRDNNTISLLFVDKAYQGQGIAKNLFNAALKNCFLIDPKPEKFFVHASPYSIPVYKKLGFVATDIMQEQFGIKYLPMEMKIDF